ncbi:helix-turn-helix domain-containing protein [Streptomyces nitrosporeus]|uniref:XRE family transcriptional regulator n=1 Tax=Streptomyces nitrosporeus TaxID=28894 RepID=A0A5J6FJ32_9ACTN|nr:XRE family transcriptional regulator [Streptomyces nitrosporeus]QEU76342.1 XRE family transcriptional regulator [Streptomyces nitrosporeus]
MNPPEGAVPDEVPGVAPRLRELRRDRGLTLETAARRAGLSPAHLSRLETGRRQPSLPMLLGLARIYGTTVSELLGEMPPERDAIVRGGPLGGGAAPSAAADGADGWRYRQAGGSGHAMQALRVHVPHGTQGDLVRVHPGEEWLYVLGGRLRVVLGETLHDLDPGDSAHYGSLTPHRISALDRAGAQLLFVHTLLQSPVAELCLGDGAHRL